MLLDVLGKFHTFQTFDDSARKRPELVRTLHGTLEEHQEELLDLNMKGAGIFFTVNETDGKGRKKENIIRVRAFFADFDTVDFDRPKKLATGAMGFLPASVVIESSPGKHHAYWILDDGECALNEFSTIQKRIAHILGSDPKVCDLARVMRVPGFIHHKGEPFRTQGVE